MLRIAPLALLLIAACSEPVSRIPDAGTGGVVDAGGGVEGEGEEGEGEGEGEGGEGEGEGGEGEGEGEGEAGVVRWVALGDTGEGNEAQFAVADVMETVCAAQGCDFALMLGDNFYDTGVDDIDDPQWQDKFELPYANLDIPFYPVLGNHDGGAFGAGLQLRAGDNQVEYSDVSDKWNMPARFYKHSHANVDFYAMDTSSLFFAGSFLDFDDRYGDLGEAQAEFLQTEWANVANNGRWRFVYGHHPYLSNGKHGNAGSYEGLDDGIFVSINGQSIKDFVEENVCGDADFFLAGHDHSRQWLTDTCEGTQFIVSGAGAKTSELLGDQPVHFQDVTIEGFNWFEVRGDTLTVQFWNSAGVMEHEGVVIKAP